MGAVFDRSEDAAAPVPRPPRCRSWRIVTRNVALSTAASGTQPHPPNALPQEVRVTPPTLLP